MPPNSPCKRPQTSPSSPPSRSSSSEQHLAHLPHVTSVAVAPNLFVVPLGPHGRPLPSAVNDDDVTAIGSEHGEYFTQDRVTVAQGRMADPTSPSEMVATAEAAKLGGWHVGETVLFGGYTVQQAESPEFNLATEPPSLRFSAKLVGLVVFPSQVVNDDVDRYPTFVLLTPALTAATACHTGLPILRTPTGPRQRRRTRRGEGDNRTSPQGHHVHLPCHVSRRGRSRAVE